MFPTFYIPKQYVLISTSNLSFDAKVACVPSGSTNATIISKAVDVGATNTTDVVEVTWNPSGTYDGWSPWGRLNWSAGFPTTSGSFARFYVLQGDDQTNGVLTLFPAGGPSPANSFYTAADAEAYAVALPPYTITGFNRYRFFIQDSPCADNAGGISVTAKVYRT